MSEVDFRKKLRKWLLTRRNVIYGLEPKDNEDVFYLRGKMDMCKELLGNLEEI